MTKADQTRLTAWRFKILQLGTATPRNVAKTCRHFGISRRAFYKWKQRFDQLGVAGLCDRPRTPRRSPTAISREVISKILYLRERYHFAPRRSPAICSASMRSALPFRPSIAFCGGTASTACRGIRNIARTSSAGSATRSHSPAIGCSPVTVAGARRPD